MEKRSPHSTYFVRGSFNSPDDYFGFFDENSDAIIADARSGFRDYGRGLVVLERSGGPFVTSWYWPSTDPRPPEFSEMTLRYCAEYDPATRIVVGVLDTKEGTWGCWEIRCDRTGE